MKQKKIHQSMGFFENKLPPVMVLDPGRTCKSMPDAARDADVLVNFCLLELTVS